MFRIERLTNDKKEKINLTLKNAFLDIFNPDLNHEMTNFESTDEAELSLKSIFEEIQDVAKSYFGENVSYRRVYDGDDNLNRIYLFNKELSKLDNYKKLKEFDQWWFENGIDYFEDIVVTLEQKDV